ncbi:threonine-phosphate decarboxylase CobD [Anaeromicrobium sediminis]|uniref:threonine-phosphate decarboxylase n=1 Tax=Anaeromicrobium sediminis TaxID=1478221 RepID=A0A267MME2_9FIRM|nr:threonine-phosphate decarboxylase CobD [Anaeromicrobium sediminis]PAB60771.1 threonine-phosphate decarboxylase [Anaeromicrobium sediminis]
MNKAKHGGNIYEIEKKYGINKEDIIDFSANINPLGVPESFKRALIENMDIIKNYPDPDYIKLKESISKHNKIDREKIIVGNGATEIIFSLIDIIKPKKSLLLAPTFAEYERALKKIDSSVEYYFLKEENNFLLDEEFLNYIKEEIDCIILCNPNNPTGKLVDKGLIEDILKKSKRKNIEIIIDEAFIDFVEDYEDKSLIKYIDEYENLHIIRALTKFFAIPGLRLGYGITSNKKIIEKFEDSSEPWTINSYADLGGQVLLEDEEYIKKTRQWIKEENNYLYKEIKGIEGIKVYKSTVNYLLLKTDKTNLKEELMKKNILIRSCDNYINLDERYFRVAVKNRHYNDKLIRALKEIYYGS